MNFLNHRIHVLLHRHTHTQFPENFKQTTVKATSKHPPSPRSALCLFRTEQVKPQHLEDSIYPSNSCEETGSNFWGLGEARNLEFTYVITITAIQTQIRTSPTNRVPRSQGRQLPICQSTVCSKLTQHCPWSPQKM